MRHEFQVRAKENSITGGTPLDTDIRVNPGDLLVITASPADTWRAGPDDRTSNANGLGNPLGGAYGLYASGSHRFLFGSLVGTFDDGQTYFGVGTYLAMTILTEGVLKLVYWDGFSDDNSGSVRATVQLYNGPRQ
jgi:hypothetical protein